jgi:N-acetylneuraminic acid mutarotase
MKRRARVGEWLVLATLAVACADPTAAVVRNAGSLPAADQSFAIRTWVTLTPDAVTRQLPAAASAGGKVYVMGGWTGNAISPDVRAFDPVTDTWTPRAPMTAPTYASLGAQTLAGQIYVIGGILQAGFALSNTVSVYDVASNTWTTTTPLPVTAGCGGSAVIAGTLYALTGCEVSGGPYTGSLFSYNTTTTQWTPRASSPVQRGYPAVTAAGGKLYAVGGVLQNGRATGDVTVFTPATGTWQTVAPNPVPRYGAVALPYGTKVVVFGGYDFNGFPLGDLWLYDPSTNHWTPVPTSGFVARAYFAGTVAGGAAYAVGGVVASGTITNALQRIFP